MTTDLGIELPPPNGGAGPDPKTTAGAMVDMLRRHYIPDDDRPAWLFATEIDAPGSSGRRADVICLGVTTATSCKLIGHEVKVNRADVMNELADLTKCDPWMRYCDHWWLVIPHPALIDGLTIPDTWGIMLPPSGRRTRSTTIHRQAPQLAPVNQAPALRVLASRAHWRTRDANWALARYESRIKDLEKERDALRALPSSARAGDPLWKFVGEVVRGLGGSTDGKQIGWGHKGDLTVDDVVEALRDLKTVRDQRRAAETGLASATAHLGTVRTIIDHAIAEVTAAQRKAARNTPGGRGDTGDNNAG